MMSAPELAHPAATNRPLASYLPPWGWLASGIVVTALVGNRFNVAVLGWVAAVPWLVYLRRTSGWKSWLALALAVQVGTFVQVAKIVTEPIPWFFAAMFSVPAALVAALLYLLFETWRRRLGDGWGLVLFPALQVVAEWAAARFSEMGSWGSLAYTQLDNLPLLQTTSLFGLSGVTVLLAATSALVAALLDTEHPSRWRPGMLSVGGLVLAAHIFGAARLHRPIPGPLVTVATVTADIAFGPDRGLPTREVLAQAEDSLFLRSARAMEQGAQVVVWNEGATVVTVAEEAAFLERGRNLAAEHGADLVIAYVVPVDSLGLFENKYVWLTPEGPAETYLKHHPVPGEGSIRGTDPVRVHHRPWGRAAGAICYDYDFPPLGLEHARAGAGLVVVPSSDWLGIDPIHTQMARVRGIEGGFSVVRSVRWATSGAYDAHGRARATASFFEGERLMIARVPTTQVPTLYTRIGDLLPLTALFLLVVGAGAFVRRGRAQAE